MNIFTDFDGCIVNTVAAIVSLYNEDFQYYKKFKPIDWTDVDTWDFIELNCTTPNYINMYFNQPRLFERLEYMDDAKEILELLAQKHKICVVSAGYSPNLKIKEKWVKEYLPFCDFVGVNLKEYDDKSHIDMSGGVFIDDSWSNIKTSNASYKICFGDVQSWNKKAPNKIRCANWYDVKRKIDEIKTKMEK